ncbi:MAG: hypothetical protein LBH96_06925 [Candidatus Peribacteria bacterium]|jgi:hypothetical protein|nr:hypothetical protein [Candidatus Peribacteria bacterium]
MKKVVILLVALVSISVNAQESKTSWYERDLTLAVEARIGTNYAPIFGARSSENIALFSMLDLSHKSGFGLGFYRRDDFTSETTGRIGFVDVYWAGTLVDNLSLYVAGEYGWWDNWKDGRFFSPYAIVSYQFKSWNFTAIPLYIYYDRLSSDNHQIMLKMEIAKEVFEGTSVRLASWYDNLNEKKFHYAVGITQKLPSNTYLNLDGVLRPGGENFIALGFGWKFCSK